MTDMNENSTDVSIKEPKWRPLNLDKVIERQLEEIRGKYEDEAMRLLNLRNDLRQTGR